LPAQQTVAIGQIIRGVWLSGNPVNNMVALKFRLDALPEKLANVLNADPAPASLVVRGHGEI
jgi:hypothetical protein